MKIKIKKGESTKQFIISESKKTFNKFGITLTLNQLANEMGITISKITNHFSTKDHLFAALSVDYDKQLFELLEGFSWQDKITFHKLGELTSEILSLQYENRCLMLFASSSGLSKTIMSEQVALSWNKSLVGVKILFQNMVNSNLLEQKVLEPENFEVIKFQYVNLLTTWLVSYTLYDHKLSLKDAKKIYVKGVLGLFRPYTTRKGKLELNMLMNT